MQKWFCIEFYFLKIYTCIRSTFSIKTNSNKNQHKMERLLKDLINKYFKYIHEKGKGPLYEDGWMKLIYDIENDKIKFQIDSESVRSNKYKISYIPICLQIQDIEDIKEGIKSFYTNNRILEFKSGKSNNHSSILDKRYADFSFRDLQALHKYIKDYEMKRRFKRIKIIGI